MLHAIAGLPGGGKSQYALRFVVIPELVHGTRVIITNLPIKLGNLNEYLQKHYPDKLIDVLTRIRILTDDQLAKFYCYRSTTEFDIPIPIKGQRPDFARGVGPGVVYVIDEVQNIFSARNWADTGVDVLYYNSQHRHMGDDVYWITQAVNNVDKHFRSVTQDYRYCRNNRLEKVMGIFRRGENFKTYLYREPLPEKGGWARAPIPDDTSTFSLDIEAANCYDTSGGVGLAGGGQADMGARVKGIPWMWFYVVTIGFILLMCLGAHLFFKHIGSVAKGSPIANPLQHLSSTNSITNLSPVNSNLSTNSMFTPKDKPKELLIYKFGSRLPDTNLPTGCTIGDGGLVTGFVDNSKDTINILSAMDVPRKTWVATVTVFHAYLNETETVGIDWLFRPMTAGGILSTVIQATSGAGVFTLTGSDISATLSAQQTKNRLRVITRPTISSLSGDTGVVSVGTEIPIVTTSALNSSSTTQNVAYKKVAFEVDLLATAVPDGTWQFKLSQTADSILSADATAPTISTQTLTSTAQLRPGQYWLCGGILTDSTSTVDKSIPVIGDIPIIGALFGSHSPAKTRDEIALLLYFHPDGDEQADVTPILKAIPVGDQEEIRKALPKE